MTKYLDVYNYNDIIYSCLYYWLIYSEASKYLTEVLASIPEELRKESINRLVDAVQKQPCE